MFNTLFERLSKAAGRLQRRWLWGGVLLLAALPYLAALQAGFVWDDTIFLVNQTAYRLAGSLWQALRQPFLLSPNYFRPLAVLSYLSDLRVWGLAPLPFHLTNLVLHLLDTGLVIAVCAAFFQQQEGRSTLWRPALAGLLYGLHPALVESTVFISGRFDLLVSLFLLLALWADLAWRAHPRRRALGVSAAFLAAALSKEMALGLLLALPVWHLVTARQPEEKTIAGWWRANRGVIAGLLAAGLLYLGLRFAALGTLYQPELHYSLPTGTAGQHFLLVARSLSTYLILAVWPFTTLSPLHTAALPLAVNNSALLWSLPALAAVGIAVTGIRRRSASSGFLAAGLLALLPVLNLLPLELGGNAYAAERYLAFPLFFWILAAIMLIPWPPSRPVLAGWGLWLAACLALTAWTVPHWQSDLTLWQWGVQRAPDSALAYTNLSKALSESGDPQSGLQAAQAALERSPQDPNAWDQKGLALFMQQEYQDAEKAFAQAVQLAPDDLLYWNNLAGALREQGRLQEAAAILIEKVLSQGELPAAHLNLGVIYLRADRPDLAAEQLQIAVQTLPPAASSQAAGLLEQTNQPERWLKLGNLLLEHDDASGALNAFLQAEQLGAPLLVARIGGSNALIALGRLDEAQAVLQDLAQQFPDAAAIYNTLGIVARERGDTQSAKEYFQQAIQLAPDWKLPQQNLDGLNGQ